MMKYVIVMFLFGCGLGCGLNSGDKNQCETQADCLDGFTCSAAKTCEPTTTCTPKTCAIGQCGNTDDGCGGTLSCGACPQPDHCTNHVQDQGESDVDCGGSCNACALGLQCSITTDCATGTCEAKVCRAGTWSQVAAMPTPRTMLGAAVGADGLIYAIGGYKENSTVTGVVEVYNPATDSWSTRASMPTPRYGFAAVLAPDNKIYTIGGEYSSTLPYSDGNSIKVEAYDPATNTWQALPSLPNGRYNPAAAVGTNGRVYVSGGFSVAPSETLGSVVSIAPGEASWTTVPDVMTTARDGHGSVAMPDGKIYVVAGYDGTNELASLEYYQPGMLGWNTLPPVPTPRKMTAATTTGGRIYVLGGNAWLSSSVVYSRAVEMFDPAANAWTTATSMPVGRFDHAVVTAPSGKIYVLGGERDNDSTNTTGIVDVYTP